MKKALTNIILVICIGVFAYSVFQLYTIYRRYEKISHDNKDLVQEVVSRVSHDDQKKEETEAYDERRVDFDRLKAINADIVGWLYVPGTNIDYPLLKGKTNQTYIRTNYKKQHSSGGSIFIDENCAADFTDANTIIYGHNMNNGSMFASLKKYLCGDFLAKHHYAYIYLADGSVNVYELFSANVMKATSEFYTPEISYTSYVSRVLQTSTKHLPVDQKNTARLIMLSTCYRHNDENRTVVFGRFLSNENV